MKNKRRTIDMTQGSIGRGIILFAIPLLISSIIQQMYNTVDLLFVGNLLGTESAAAVGASSMLITCLIGLFSGMAVGTNVILAKIFGSGDKEKFANGMQTAVSIAVIGGIVLTIIGITCSPYFLKLMNTPDNIMNEAVSYIRIYFISITPMLLYNMGSGIARAGGNSKVPMTAQFLGGLMNIAANTLFVYILGWGIKGASFATFCSQTTASLLVLLYLMKDNEQFNFNLKKLNIDKDILKEIAVVGIPAGIQALVISLSNVIVQSYINSLDVNSIAAFTCYMKIELLLYYPIVAIGQAIMTFTGQNIGAGNIKRIRKGVLIGAVYGIAVILIGSRILLWNGDILFSLFNKSDEVISKGREIISVTFPFYFIYVILEVFSSVIRGSGRSIPPMIIILTNICTLRVLLLYLMESSAHTIKGIALVYPITWAAASIFMMMFYAFHMRNLQNKK